MTASNDNRRVRKKSSKAKTPKSLAKMTRVLAEIYARPPNPIVGQPDESLAWLGDEQLVPPIDHHRSSGFSNRFPGAEAKR
jgi:hypothetical protein